MTTSKFSGIDWIGDIPENWRTTKFRHAFRESSEVNGAKPVGPMLSISSYHGVQVKEYSQESLKRDDDQLENYRVVKPGQLAVNTMWLNYGGLGVSEHLGHMSPAYRAYEIKNGFYPKYVHHLLRSEAYVRGYTALLTGVRPNSLQMSRENLMNFPVLVPPIDEQKAIAEFLDRETAQIDNLIAKQKQLMSKLSERREALINHVVWKGLNTTVEMRRHLNPRIEEFPLHWVACRLKDVATITPSNVDKKSYEEGIPVKLCNYVDVYYNDFITGDIQFQEATATRAELAKFQLQAGWVIITKDSESSEDIGVSTFVENDMDGVVCGYHLSIIIAQGDNDGLFLKWFFDATITKAFMAERSNGLTRMALGQGAISSLPLVLPPATEQRQIAVYLREKTSDIDTILRLTTDTISKLKERRKALISAAVTGKISVGA